MEDRKRNRARARASTQYYVYGLCVATDEPIASLAAAPASAPVDLWVHFHGGLPIAFTQAPRELWYTSPHRNAEGCAMTTVWRLRGGRFYHLVYCSGAAFVVDDSGSHVWCAWTNPLGPEEICSYLLGPILGFVLRLRGFTCLHAAGIAIDGAAILLVGPQGAGKSTTAAAFARLGYGVLSDDVAVLMERDGQFYVQPGYPGVRLWPTSVHALFGSLDSLPRLAPSREKRYLDLRLMPETASVKSLPVAAVFLLCERSAELAEVRIELERGHQGLLSLIANSYVNYLVDRQVHAGEFDLLGRLATRVPLYRLTAPDDLMQINELCGAIVADRGKPGGYMCTDAHSSD